LDKRRLAQFQVKLVVDIELHAPGQGGPGVFLFHMPAIGGDGLVFLNVGGIAQAGKARRWILR
jgi:hypothetical protein